MRGIITWRRQVTRSRLSLGVLIMLGAAGPPASAQDVGIYGREVDVHLRDGIDVRGELIEASGDSLLLMTEGRLEPLVLDDVLQVRIRRHNTGGAKTALWVGIAGALTAGGLSYACGQVEGASCGGVAPVALAVWAVLGIPMAIGVNNSQWQKVPPDGAQLRAYSRFPQGAPVEFRMTPSRGRSQNR